MARRLYLILALLSAAFIHPLAAATSETLYADALSAGWEDWSWSSTRNFSNTTPIKNGTDSLAITYTAAWAGLYLHSSANITASGYSQIQFWVHGGASGTRSFNLTAYDGSQNPANVGVNLTAPSNTWTSITVTLSALGSPSIISGFTWQDTTGATQPKFYLDDIILVAPNAPPPPPPTLTIDVGSNRKPISPYIYGMNFADEDLATDLHLPVRRRGGNSTTRYNWQNDTSNHASDWFFENIPEDNANPGALPDGSDSDNFVDQDRRTGTKTIITMPLIGWAPKSRAYAPGFSVTKYGGQQSVDPYRPDMGNGIYTNGSVITGNDPLDTSIAIGPSFDTSWIAHLQGRYGTASAGGVAFYSLDNETELWSSTHRDVRPVHLGYDEMRNRAYQYASAIKAADPAAKTLGPVSYGWTAYYYSDLDTAPGGSWWNNPLDRNAHGGTPLNDWYLQQMKLYEQTTGTRILDYFDLHYYPDAPGVTLTTAGSAATQDLRLRSTRSLWDSSYNDESWIGSPVRLIPRMKEWVNTNYPGTKTSITEYNWGGLESINGALAQADVLGIFGREGLDLATLWAPPSSSDPGAYAFRMYLNYNGTGATFGDISVQAASADQSQLAVYASQKTTGNAVTMVVINKTATDLTSTATLAGFSPGAAAKVYRYSSANLAAIQHLANQPIVSNTIAATFPASSITLFEIPQSTADASLSWVSME